MPAKTDVTKVLTLLGSPRKKGNTAALADQINKGAEKAGAVVESLYLNGMQIKPCQGCYACQAAERPGCAVDDDMQQIYPRLLNADAWVIASPVYWFTMSAQMKTVLDRCFALFNEGQLQSPFAGKRIAIAMSYGDTDAFSSGCVNALRTFQDAFSYVGAEIVGMVYGTAEEPGEIKSNLGLMQQAEELGRKLVAGSS